MRNLLATSALLAVLPVVAVSGQALSPTDGGGAWQVSCVNLGTDSPPACPASGYVDAVRVSPVAAGWTTPPINGAYYISSVSNGSIWSGSPNENPHYQYTFRTTFDPGLVSSYNFGTIDFSALWLDNYWVGWSLNGSAFSNAGISPTPLPPNGGNWTTPFTLALTGLTFVPGSNTFEIRILGNGRTDALLASGSYGFDSDQPFETVPEPATMTLLATGLVGMAASRRRRKGSA